MLLIGDAAHTMSPVGGVGISVAIQDAAVTANVLAPPAARERGGPGGGTAPAQVVGARRPSQPLSTPPGEAAGRIPLGFSRAGAVLSHLAGRIFGLGVRPVRLTPAPTRRPFELQPLPVEQ